jgi:transposase
MIAANMFDQKLDPKLIAKSLNVAVQTVRGWRRIYRVGGREALWMNRHPGRPPLLSEPDRETLAALLLQTPAECGFDKYLWTTQLIADLIKREFQVSYHNDHVGKLLERIGFTHQKPARRARERDEVKIEGWRRETWPALLKKASNSTA